MANRQRDYHAEYVARVQRATEKGYTRSEATGHAKVSKGEIPLSIRNAVDTGKPSATAKTIFRSLSTEERVQVVNELKPRLKPKQSVHDLWSNLLGSP